MRKLCEKLFKNFHLGKRSNNSTKLICLLDQILKGEEIVEPTKRMDRAIAEYQNYV